MCFDVIFIIFFLLLFFIFLLLFCEMLLFCTEKCRFPLLLLLQLQIHTCIYGSIFLFLKCDKRSLVLQSSVVFAHATHTHTHTPTHEGTQVYAKVLLQCSQPPALLALDALTAHCFFIMRNKRVKVSKSCAKPLRTLGNLWKNCKSNCSLLFHPSSQLLGYFLFVFACTFCFALLQLSPWNCKIILSSSQK